MKVYVTQYALTKGIEEFEASQTKDFPQYVTVKRHGWDSYVHKPNWHTDRTEAVMQALAMRIDKIASLKKQLARLEAMTFDEKE
jgi:hypothetical protein